MNEDERRRAIAQLQEVVRGPHIASAGKNPQVEFPRAARVEAPARAADPSDAMCDHRNYEDELEDFLPGHEEQFSTFAAIAANFKSRPYLLGAAAIVIVLGLWALAASFAFRSSTSTMEDTAQILEPKTSELEQEERQAEAMPRDIPNEDAQQSSALRDNVGDASEASPPTESSPAASEANHFPTASPQPKAQDPLAAAAPLAQPLASFNAPALPTGAFLAQEPPQGPAAKSTEETLGGSGTIAHARGETPVEPLVGSPQLPPKRASLPRRRSVSAPSERPRAKAAQGGQEGGAPPQETPRDTGGAEAHRPSEYILQRALDALNGSE